MKDVEIELRALLEEEQFTELSNFMKSEAQDLGEDNKDTYFFLLPDKLLKVTNNLSKKTAKLTLKLKRIGAGSDFKELEILIDPNDVNKTCEILSSLGFNDTQYSYQFRHNYRYKDVEFALKYTQSWGFHVEMEILIAGTDDKAEAAERIKKVAEELDLDVMSDEQLSAFTQKIDDGWNRGAYDKETFQLNF